MIGDSKMRLMVKHTTGPVEGDLVIPNSKYHAHRALMLAALAPGLSRIDGLSDAGHVRHTIAALRGLGVEVTMEGQTFLVHGGQFRPAKPEVSVGSSGTTLYFLTGLVSLASAPVTIVGQKYFQHRPITPLLAALQGLGVNLCSDTGCPPIQVQPKRPTGGRVSIVGTLSQWISGLLLLAPFATGPSVVEVEGELNERTYIDLTMRMMKQFGLHVEASPGGRRYEIEGNQQPHAANVTLPPDIGSAAFGLASVALHPADVLFRGLSTTSGAETDHPEADLLDIVGEMGLPMVKDPATGFIRVCHNGGIRLNPVRVDCRLVPDMLPVLSVLGSSASGTSVLDNIAHVRLKESDRVSAMLQLNQMGGNLEVRGDALYITGVPRLRGADLSSFNDHRVLMALAIAGTRAEGETRLTFPNAYRISYPRFLEEMNGIGMSMAVAPATPREKARPAMPASGTGTPARVAKTRIGDWVRRWARERPDGPAVIGLDANNSGAAGERFWTWRELDAEADKVASLLLELGAAPGEAVSCQLPNVAEFTALALATNRIGAVCCPLMPIFREREISFMLAHAEARVLIVPATFRGRNYPAEIAAVASAHDLPLEHVIVLGGEGTGAGTPAGAQALGGVRGNLSWHSYAEAVGWQRPDGAALDARTPAPDALAQLLFTSGTSGEPKGVLQRMDSLTRAAAMEIRHLGLTGDDRIYIPSPLAHQTGYLYGMWLAFLLGVPQLLQQVWDAEAALSLLRRHGGTFVQAATPFLADLVEAVDESGQRPDHLRIFVATGAAVPRALAERATRTLDAAVCGAWGTTETCLGSLAAPGDEPAKVWGTDGRALTGVRLRITDDDGNVLAAGQEGNFEVKSGCLFAGYLDHPDLTAKALTPDGWYRSGDLAVIAGDGYVRISGRVKDVINRGGEKVPVAEIEQLLHTHPKVRSVAVVAMPDNRLGERACAFVVTAEGTDDLSFAGMQRFLDEAHMAKQYWPERLEIIEVMPRTQTGKVQKFVLRERIRAMIEDETRGEELVARDTDEH
jgi:cyclohexanecarboxylate-CoA ligase